VIFLNDIVINVILLFGLVLLITLFNTKFDTKNFIFKSLLGLIIGAITMFIMTNSFVLETGAIFDTRSVIIGVTALFFPFTTSIVATIVAIIYRITIGGIGVYAGSLSILFSFIIGVFWKKYIQDKLKFNIYIEYYLFGLLIHIFVILAQFSFPYPRSIEVISLIYPFMLGIFPFATLLLCLTLKNHQNRLISQKKIMKSEEKYRLLSTQMPSGLVLCEVIYNEVGDPIDFIFVEVNDSWKKLVGLSEEEVINKRVYEVFPKTKRSLVERYASVALTGNPIKFESYDKNLNKHIHSSVYSPQKNFFAAVIEDITERKRNEEKVIHASKHDFLTGLPNRRFYDEKISELDKQCNYPLLVSMIDIDGLKLINDTYGHFAGDQAILMISKLLTSEFGENAFIARIGGDEFILLSPKTDVAQYKAIRNKVLDKFADMKVYEIPVSVSFGGSLKTLESESIDDVFVKAENDMYSHKALHAQSSRSQAIIAVFESLKEKHIEERIHSDRVSKYCNLMGHKLELSTNERLELELAGRMHDIGKITIPDHILKKPGKLSDNEWEIMKTHTTNGYQILRSADKYSRLADYALTHHERWDGKGYPKGLKEDEIPLYSRIISIADAYEAMTSDRPYRKALSKDIAVNELIRCSGTQFDQNLVNIFIDQVLSIEID